MPWPMCTFRMEIRIARARQNHTDFEWVYQILDLDLTARFYPFFRFCRTDCARVRDKVIEAIKKSSRSNFFLRFMGWILHNLATQRQKNTFTKKKNNSISIRERENCGRPHKEVWWWLWPVVSAHELEMNSMPSYADSVTFTFACWRTHLCGVT